MTVEEHEELKGLLNDVVGWSYAFGLMKGRGRGEYFHEGQLYAPFQVEEKQKEAMRTLNEFLKEKSSL